MFGEIDRESEDGFVGTFDVGYYFSRRTGLFLGLLVNGADDFEAVRIGVEHFFNESIRIRAYFERDFRDDGRGDSDQFGLSLGCRFCPTRFDRI